MMKTMKIKTLLYSFAVVAAGVLLASCKQKEEPGEAKAVGAGDSYVIFAPVDAPAQTISIYADGSWAVDVDEPWIEVSPMTGEGMGSITVSVTNNMTGGVMDSPREGTITLQGRFRERRMIITVYQDGDNYYGVEEMTLAQVAALDDDSFAKIPSAQVVALSGKGFIVTDGTASLYVKGTGPAFGDRIALNGKKIKVNGAPAFELDEFEVKENKEVIYPEPKDITSTLPSYDPTVTEFVSLSASLVGTNIWVSSDVQIPILDPLENLGLGALDLHKVVYKGYGVGKSMLVTAVEDGGLDEALIPYPLKFKVRVTDINYTADSFAEDSRIDPVNGLGYLEYVPFDLASTDANKKYKLDVSDNSPRVTGPWPGDYWLFYGNGAVKAGSEVHIIFEARTSATGHKFWMLEFLDGEEWRPACETFTTNEPGEEVVYTHAMNADGSTNVKVNTIVKYRKNSDHAQFRFRCMANWQASGAGALQTRNGGSARLSVTDTSDATYQPTIEIIKEGDGVEKDPVYATIEVSSDLLTFNGTPDAPKAITVTSDHDFTVTTPADWLSFDVTEGLAGEATEIKVTCAPSELSELRQTTIKIVSEDSDKVINVIQSAAGQQLDPFISLSTGNIKKVNDEAGSFIVKVQTNTEVSYEAPDWVKVTPADTKAMVEWHEYLVEYEANEVIDTPRTGSIRFFNTDLGLESVLTLTQEGKPSRKVYFKEDFEWLSTYSELVGAGDSVANNDPGASAPNIYTNTTLQGTDLLTTFASKGYEDINPSPKVVYLQKNYLKFGKTANNTGIKLPAMEFEGDTPVTVELVFDWCAHVKAGGIVDPVKPVVELVGPGVCVDSDAKVSEPILTTQTNAMVWQTGTSVILAGVTKDTRIIIRPQEMTIASGVTQRWYLDNIKVLDSDYKYVAPVNFPVDWSFKEPGDDWKDGVDWHAENPTGSYVYSDTHEGKMSVVRFGGAPNSKPTYKKDTPLGTRLLHYGMYKDDYWLFELECVKNPAGTYTIGYGCCSSGAGPKFFALEYSLDGGENWTGINTKTESITLNNGSSARDVTYTYAISPTSDTANEACVVTESFHLDAMKKTKLMIRARVADTMKLDRSAEMASAAHGGTNRIGGQAQIAFTADSE